jgi:copper chaperone CopZ
VSEATLAVPEIDCVPCARAITKTLKAEAASRDVRVDVPAQQVRLESHEQELSLGRVKLSLAEEGCTVERVTPAGP